MQMRIFLDIQDVRFLSEMIPATARARGVLARATRAREYWGMNGPDVVIECDDMDGLDLLEYAELYCPDAAANIRQALRLANPQRVSGQSRILPGSII